MYNPQQGNPQLEAALDKINCHPSMRSYLRGQVASILTQTPTLKPLAIPYMYNNGNQVLLLCLEGTLDTTFKTKIYHFPLRVFIPQNFPQAPPMCYVNPTANMYINKKATYINPDGSITLQYLNYWNQGTTSSLNGLLAQIRLAFGNITPMFERQQQNYGVGGAGGAGGYQGNQMAGNGMQGGNGGAGGYQQAHGGYQAGGMGGMGGMMAAGAAMGGAAATGANKQNYVQEITPKLRNKIQENLDKYSMDLERLQGETKKLKQNAQVNEQHREDLKKRLTEVEQKSQDLDENNAKLKEWIDTNGDMTLADKDVNDLVVAQDALSAQILDLLAEKNAVEDCTYALEKCFRKGTLPLDDYLKGIRELARKECKIQYILFAAMNAQ